VWPMPTTPLRRSAAIVLSGAVLGGAAGAGAVAVLGDGATTTTIVRPAAATAGGAPTSVAETASAALTPRQIYQQSADSVVHVTSTLGAQRSSSPFDPQGSSGGEATGSGFFVTTDGQIVTNAHVVDGATSVTVKLAGGQTRTAKVLGKDNSSDLALLKIDTSGLTVHPLTLADSAKVEVGDATAAIGNPFGLDRTLTTGVVSAVHRTIQAPDGFSISNAIQTDAALNPGNSGGPLLDDHGRVIGVNSQIYTGSQTGDSSSSGNTGLGFAVPSDTVQRVVAALRSGQSVKYPFLGVQASDATSGIGATVAKLTASGPAADAGLRAGDTITALDGQPVGSSDALTAAVNSHAPGDKVAVSVRRGGQTLKLTVTLGTRPAQATS
jgi:putative serine protease PepD